jgi:hypothetical protein
VLAVLGVVAKKVGVAMAAMLDGYDLTADQAMTAIWRSLANDELDPYFRVYIELLGLAIARRRPYEELQTRIYQEWVAWLEPRIAGPVTQRRAAAIAAFGVALTVSRLRVRAVRLTVAGWPVAICGTRRPPPGTM